MISHITINIFNLCHLTGYEENVDDVVKNAKFVEDYNSMVAVKDIGFYSLCEHHLIPFYGKVSKIWAT